MAGLPNVAGVFSGVMLISAGIAVFAMRRMHRRELGKIRAEHAAQLQAETGKESSLLRLVWRKEYECGNAVIDGQHRQLFDLGNSLLNAILTHKPSIEISSALDTLLEHVERHFRTEEEIHSKMEHPMARRHRMVHEELWARAQALRHRYRSGAVEIGDVFGFVAYDVVAKHLAHEDKLISGHDQI